MKKDFPDRNLIEFVGLDDENNFERHSAFDAAARTYFKIKRIVNNEETLKVHIKTHNEGGKKKYTAKSKIKVPGIFLEGSATEWAFAKAVQESLKKLERQAREKIK
jgi:ribosome-associated translation inhibitor RaiA